MKANDVQVGYHGWFGPAEIVNVSSGKEPLKVYLKQNDSLSTFIYEIYAVKKIESLKLRFVSETLFIKRKSLGFRFSETFELQITMDPKTKNP